ncbi:hypothetical protein BpHYR1_004487 [Brachionus plicatilis]|uniref:Uncharacterized protein n=1 Tax=Brachionus plicatilis TaxID=10195 RepID=A0A3M7S9Z2_BRAPC|nr:hypothetical protein BpHYR1_004487 [Brachionus plicatilis]
MNKFKFRLSIIIKLFSFIRYLISRLTTELDLFSLWDLENQDLQKSRINRNDRKQENHVPVPNSLKVNIVTNHWSISDLNFNKSNCGRLNCFQELNVELKI